MNQNKEDIEDPCEYCIHGICEQCGYGYKTKEERLEIIRNKIEADKNMDPRLRS